MPTVASVLSLELIRRRRRGDPWQPSRASVADRIENRGKGVVLLVIDVEPCGEGEGFRTTVLAVPGIGGPLPAIGDSLTIEVRFTRRRARVLVGSPIDRFLAGFPVWPSPLA